MFRPFSPAYGAVAATQINATDNAASNPADISGSFDHADKLVTQDTLEAGIASHNLQVCTTDPGRPQATESLVVTWSRLWIIGAEAELAVTYIQRLHCFLLASASRAA
jgi:hypothetical protein